jgi:hypothetical protein
MIRYPESKELWFKLYIKNSWFVFFVISRSGVRFTSSASE